IVAIDLEMSLFVAGWLRLFGDRRWVFAGVGLYALVVLLATLRLPETLQPEARTPLRVCALLGSLLHVGRSPLMLRIASASAFAFASQFVFVAGASLFVVNLLGLGEQDFWVLFVPLIAGMLCGAWVVGRVAELIPRSRLITFGFVGAVAATLLNLLLVSLAPPFTGGLHWSLLMAVCGPMLIAFTVALVFAPIQLEVLDLFPHERGPAASPGTSFGLLLTAVLAGVASPRVSPTALGLARMSAGVAVLGGARCAGRLPAAGGGARRCATRCGGAPGAAAGCRHRAAACAGCVPGRSLSPPGTVPGARQAT